MFRKQTASNRASGRRNVLSRRLRIERMEPRLLMSAEAFELIGLEKVRQEFPQITGSGVDPNRPFAVVVIDTKVDSSHELLDDQIVYSKNFIGGSEVDDSSVRPDHHGTHVAGIVAAENGEYGVAPGAKLIVFNASFDGENFTDIDLRNALAEASAIVDDYNIIAVNMSLGSGFYTSAPTDASNRLLSGLIDNLETDGVTVVSAVGNSYAGPSPYGFKQNSGSPGIYSTINVGAVWEDGNPTNSDYVFLNAETKTLDYWTGDTETFADAITSFSQRPLVASDNTLFAPGGGIESTSVDGRIVEDYGTSMASPMVAGAVAIVQHAAEFFGGTRLQPSEITQLFRSTATLITDGDDESSFAYHENRQTGALTDLEFVYTNQVYPRLDLYAAVKSLQNRFQSQPSRDTNNTLQTATPISLPTPDSFNMVPSTFVPTRRDRDLLPTGKAAPIVGNIGNDGASFVGSRDVDLYRFQLDMDANLKFAEQEGLSGAVLRLFNEAGANVPLFSQQANLVTGTYYLGVSTSPNNSYNPVSGSGANSGGAQGDYSIQIDVTPLDVNGTIDTATRVSVSVAEGTFTKNEDGFFTKAIDAGVSTWVEASLGKDKIFGGTEYAIPNDIDVYRVTAPADGKMMIDVDGKDIIEIYRSRTGWGTYQSNRDVFSADFQLHVYRRNGAAWNRLTLGAGENASLATNNFGETTEETRRLAAKNFIQNKSNSHGHFAPSRPADGTTRYGGRVTDPFVSFDASAGDEFAIVVFHNGNQNYSPTSLNGRSAVVGNGGIAPYDYDIFFNFSSSDVDQTMSTALVPSNGGVLSINGDTVGGQVTLGEDIYGTRTLIPGSDDVDLIKVVASEEGVIDFSLQGFGSVTGNTPTRTVLRAFDENGNPLHSVESSTTGFNEIKVAVDGPKVIYIGVSGAGNDSYGISRSVAQTQNSSLPAGRKSSFDYFVDLLESNSSRSGSNNDQSIEVSTGAFVMGELGIDNALMFAEVKDDVDRFSFTAESSSSVKVIAIPDLEAHVGVLIRVFDSKNNEVVNNSGQSKANVAIFDTKKGETYSIVLTAKSDFDRGNYTLRMVNVDTLPPQISQFSPNDDSTDVKTNAELQITFNENVRKGTGNVVVRRLADNSVFQSLPVSGSNVTVNNAVMSIALSQLMEEGVAYYVELSADAVEDIAGNSFAGISGDSKWNFVTESDETLEEKARKLDEQHQFETESAASFNWGGQREKWIQAADRAWYFMLPNGQLYRWGGGARSQLLSASTSLGTLDSTYYATLSKLINASESGESLEEKAYRIDQSLNLVLESPGSFNWGRQSEKWIRSANQTWYFMLPNGQFYRWGGGSREQLISASELLETFDNTYYTDTDKLINAPDPGESLEEKAYRLDQQLGFDREVSTSFNWGGQNEKWIRATDQRWYFMLSDGRLYRWGGGARNQILQTSHLLETFDATYYAQIQKLVNAPDPGESLEAKAYRLDQELGFDREVSASFNWGGQNEKWIRATDQRWYFMLSDGRLYRWGGGARNQILETSQLLATFNSTFYSNIDKIVNALRP